MRLLYLANIRLPTEKAHGAQIMKTCEALVRAGTELTLVVPDRKSAIAEDPFAYYGITDRFPILRITVPDTVAWGRFGFLLETFVFALRARRAARAVQPEVVYGRDEQVLWFVPRRYPIVWETHTGAWNFFARAISRAALRVVAISQGLKAFYVEHGLSADRIAVAPDGVDLEEFERHEPSEAVRRRLGIPFDKKIVLYVGRLDGWKGSDVLLAAAKLLPQTVLTVLVGGEPNQVTRLRIAHPQVLFTGEQPYRDIAHTLAAGDVLVLPNTAHSEISAKFTSPLKLFAYMASEKPIVAADIPSIREILDEQTAAFAAPDDPKAFARAIAELLNDPGRALRLAGAARERVRSYSWDARAARILAASDVQ